MGRERMVEEIRHQRHITGCRDVEHLDAVDGFVRAVVHIGRIGAKRRGRQQVGDALGTLGHPVKGLDIAVLARLVHGTRSPDTGQQIVSLLVGAAEQVHGHGGELATAAAVHEQHLVVVRHRQQLAQIGFGLGGDRHVGLAAVESSMTEAPAPEITKFALGALHDFDRQHGGAGAEVVNLFAHDAFREWMSVIGDLSGFTQVQPRIKGFWELAQPLSTRRQRS